MNLENATAILTGTAFSLGFIHTLLGPDHYLPFIALSRARSWSIKKTILITSVCAGGHIASSVIIGLGGIAISASLPEIEWIENSRAEIASWLLLTFGLIYMIWGIKQALSGKKHSHWHTHANSAFHSHNHNHLHSKHMHIHNESGKKITPWVLFIIFVFGPCEPLIPLLMYPAAAENVIALLAVISAFSLSTAITMTAIVYLSVKGINLIPSTKNSWFERYTHALAGAMIFGSGAGVIFFGW